VKVEQPSGEKSHKMETDMSNEKMTPEAEGFDLDAFAKDAAEKAVAEYAMKQAEAKAAEEKAKVETAEKQAQFEADEKAAQEAKQEEQKQVVTSVISGAERLMSDVEKRVNEKQEDLESVVKGLQSELAEKSEEIMNIRESKRHFADRQGRGDWKKVFEADILDAKFAGLATGKGWNTDAAKSIMEKANAHSGVGVSSDDFEQIVSTNVERDIQNGLV